MDQTPMQQGEILLYNNDGEKEFVSVVFRDETFWLTQKAMAELEGHYTVLYLSGGGTVRARMTVRELEKQDAR